jgi:hypothetical protein
MEKSPLEADARQEKINRSLDAIMYLLIGVTVAISAADLWSHPNLGIADLERRKLLMAMFGRVTRHIGNYGFTAILTASTVFAKHIMLTITDKETTQRLIKFGFLTAIASLIALSASLENTLSSNPEGLNDFAFAILAILITLPATELLVRKVKRVTRRKKSS